MSDDPFAVVTVRKSGRPQPVVRPKQEEEDDPFAAVQVRPKERRPMSFTQGEVKDVPLLNVGAPSFRQFEEASAELADAPTIPTGMKSPIVTRAKAPTSIEKVFARQLLDKGPDPFGAGKMNEAQKAQLDRTKRALAMAESLGEFGVQGAGGYADALGSVAQGLGSIADVALPGTPVENAVRRGREFLREDVVGAPETVAGLAGNVAGSLAGTARAFMAPAGIVAGLSRTATPGTAVQKALQFAANPIGKAGLTQAGRINRLGQLASGAAISAPINIAYGLSPESSAAAFAKMGQEAQGQEGALASGARALGAAAEPFAGSAAGRAGFEVLSDIVPSALFTGIGGAASQASRAAGYMKAQRLAREGDVPGAIAAIKDYQAAQRMSGADDISKSTAPMDTPTIPKKPTQGRLDREEFSSRIGRALDAGDDAEVTRLLERQDEVLAGVAPTEAPAALRPAAEGQTSVLGRPFAPSMVTKAVRKETPSVAGAAWAARQRELGERGVPEVRSNVAEYGQASQPMPRATAVDKEFQKKVADWYDKAESNPDDKEVQKAYRAFAEETSKQYEYLTNKGVKFEFVDNPSTYRNSGEMMKDIAENKHLFVFRTGEDFNHPLLSREENDQFRAVHDYFGHAAYGHQFGELGEENAFRVHAATFSPEARRAMATETRGQNSWVNTRPENLAAPGTVYADQKVVLLPKQFMDKYPAEKPLGALANRAVYLANMGGRDVGAAAAGAAVGASADEENRLRGAGIGALGALGAVRGSLLGPATRLIDDAADASKFAADVPQQPKIGAGVGGVVEDVVAPVASTAPAIEAVAEPVKAQLPPITRPEKGPLFRRAPDFGTGSNEYVINANGIEDGWRVWRDTDSGSARGQWYVTAPRGGQFPLVVWTKKEAEQAALNFINTARERGYVPNPDFGGPIPYEKITSPSQVTQPVASALAGKTFDVGGALGEGVSALSKVPGGKAQLAKVGLGGVGYGLSQAEDERLQAHGNALMGIAAYSLVHGKVKQGARAAGATMAQELAKSSVGRKLLDEISLDIRVDPRVKETVEVATREMAKYRAIGRELAAEAKARGGVFDRTVSDLVEKEAVEAASLSPEDMAIAIALAQKIADNSLGLKKVEARLLSADTYAKRGTTYLPRRYAKYDSKDVNDVVVQHKGKTFRIGGERIRNDELTREERDALGEIREASYRIADYFGRGSKDIATAHLFEALSEIPGVIHPEYVNAVKEAAIAADLSKVARTPTATYRGSPTAGKDALRAADAAKARAKGLSEQFKRQGQEYVTLPDTPQLGVLRGAVVRKDAADYLNDLPDFQSTNRMYNRLMHIWKSAHTVFNVPATHLTNATSNVFMGILGGLPIQEQVVAIPRALKDIQEYGPITRFLTEAGVIERALPTYGDTPIKGLARDETVLRSLMNTTRPETRAALEAQGLKPIGKVEGAARKIGGKIERAYSIGDTMFRVALFDKLTRQGMGQEDALKKVMETLPGYDTRSPLLKKLKHISPFVMYSAKYLPAALDLIAEYPWRWALASASWAAIDQASRRQAGAVREEDLPPNKRFGRLGYLKPGLIQTEALGLKPKEAGKRLMFDVARFTPFTALTGSTAPGTTISAVNDKVPALFQPSGPLMDIVARLGYNVDPFSGKKFIKNSDDAMDKLKKFTVGTTEAGRFSPGLAASLLLPSSLTYHLPNLAKDLAYKNTDAAKLSAMGLFGGRPIAVKRGQRAQIEGYEYEQKIREITQDLKGELRATKDPAIRRSMVKEAMEKRRRVTTEYRESRQRGKK